jgi:hypothetical protein
MAYYGKRKLVLPTLQDVKLQERGTMKSILLLRKAINPSIIYLTLENKTTITSTVCGNPPCKLLQCWGLASARVR